MNPFWRCFLATVTTVGIYVCMVFYDIYQNGADERVGDAYARGVIAMPLVVAIIFVVYLSLWAYLSRYERSLYWRWLVALLAVSSFLVGIPALVWLEGQGFSVSTTVPWLFGIGFLFILMAPGVSLLHLLQKRYDKLKHTNARRCLRR